MPLNLLGVNGSLRDSSYGAKALDIALAAAREFGAQTRLLNLRDADLPMYNPDASQDHPNIIRALGDVTWAHAYILATPDYHGSMSGAVKNFLDYHWTEFAGKLFAYLCASHEKGLTVMDQMRTAVRHCYGWSLPYGISVNSHEDFDLDGNLKSSHLRIRLRMMSRDVVTYGSQLYDQFQQDIANNIPDSFAARYQS